ncbi:hypothetical protein RN22_08840 [Grimontia sp. AD028]|nr:hypothetical protein RN22_08840 [Grimontia sp. AD028]
MTNVDILPLKSVKNVSHVYPSNLKMLVFRGHQCVQFEANFTRNSHSISVEFNEEVGALRASLRAS